jgi:hypothetical protein
MELKKFNDMQNYLVENIGNSKGAFRAFVKQDRDAERLEFNRGGIADELKKFVQDFLAKNGRIPTQNEIVQGTGRAAKTIKSYLVEGKDYAKPLTKLEAAKLAGAKSRIVRGEKAGVVSEVSEDLVKRAKDLRVRGVSIVVDTNPAGNKFFKLKITDKNIKKFGNEYLPATEENLLKLQNKVETITSSSEYKNVKQPRSPEEDLAVRRDKAAVYRKQDPYRVYEKLSKYKTKRYPNLSKDLVIHHSQPKFRGQTLNRFSLIPASLNISEPMMKLEAARNAIITNRDNLLKNPNLTLAERKRIIDETNAKQTRLKNNMRGPLKGLIDFELADMDAEGNVTTKSKGFDLRKGMSFADELGDLDLSKITQEQADELLALGKKNIDLQALSKVKGVSFASQLNSRVPLLQDLFDMARSIPDDLMKKNYLKAGGKILGLAFTPVIAYDTYKAYEEGKPVLEALEQGFIGTDLIGATKRLVALTPEEREARSVVKQEETDIKIGEDFSGLDSDFAQPRIKTELKLEDAKEIFEKGKKRVKDKEAKKNLERATKRSNFKQMIMDKLFPDPTQQIELAGGGIAKQGGVEEGPAPEAGPTPDGLPIDYNNVKKVKE